MLINLSEVVVGCHDVFNQAAFCACFLATMACFKKL